MQQHPTPPTCGRFRRLARRLGAAAAALVVTATMAGSPAAAQTYSGHAKMMCYGRDRLYISTPAVFADEYVDLAAPEVFRLTAQGWQPYFWGSTLINDDAPVTTSPGTIGGAHTWPYMRWWNSETLQPQTNWDHYIPTGTTVAVRMWFRDGRTGQWTSSWTTNIGDIGGLGTSCRAGQYQG